VAAPNNGAPVPEEERATTSDKRATTRVAPTFAPTDETAAPKRKTLGDMMGAFKSIVTVKYIDGVKTMNWEPFDKRLLQRDYYEHIIRDWNDYIRISEYIINNPVKWESDRFYNK
jgi:hypothetical protein